MKLTRGDLTNGEQTAFVLTILLAAVLYIFGPSIYMTATGAQDDAHGHVIPKHGTVQYEEFMSDFETEHGHPWSVQNEMDAAKNGVLLIGRLVLILICITIVFGLIHDLRCYAYEKKILPRDHMPAKIQASRVAIYLALLAVFAGAFFTIPLFVVPVS